MDEKDRTRARGLKPAGNVLLRPGSFFFLAAMLVGCLSPRGGRDRGGVVPTASPQLPSPITGESSATPSSTAPAASPSSPSAETGTPTPSEPGFVFATFLAVPVDRAFAGNAQEIRAAFRNMRALGINAVGQIFPLESTEADWKVFLDIAAEEGMLVISAFPQAPKWDGQDFELGVNGVFLQAFKDHPALYAHFLVDEPFHQKHNWEITTERLQFLYRQAKSIAPNVRMQVGFSREIMRAEQGDFRPGYAFKAETCDICVISTLEFRNYGQGNRFEQETAVTNHLTSRAVIKREAPDVQIMTTVQVFGSVGTTEGRQGSTYYMPTPEELQEAIDLLLSPELQAAGELDGILFQQWASELEGKDPTQYTLSDPEFEAQREIVRATAERLGLPVPSGSG